LLLHHFYKQRNIGEGRAVIHSLLKWFRPRRPGTRVNPRPRFLPALEALERRWVPATLSVNSVADSTTAARVLTLREAVSVLNFGTLTIKDSVLSNNAATANGGGGIYNVGSLSMTNTTFTGNSTGASSAGAGLYNIGGGTATLTNCTFNNNVAGGSGSGGSE